MDHTEIDLKNLEIKTRKEIIEDEGKGVNSTEIVSFSDGTKAIWKPHEETWSSNYRAEVLAYELDRKLGINLVPPTVVREVDGKIGSLQRFVPSVPGKAARQSDLDKQSFFDYLIDNRDRHNGNFLVQALGSMASIDNGLSFTGAGFKAKTFESRRGKINSFLRSAEGKQVISNVRSYISDSSNYQQLREYLGEQHAARTIERMKKIIEYNDKIINPKKGSYFKKNFRGLKEAFINLILPVVEPRWGAIQPA